MRTENKRKAGIKKSVMACCAAVVFLYHNSMTLPVRSAWIPEPQANSLHRKLFPMPRYSIWILPPDIMLCSRARSMPMFMITARWK